MRPPDMLTLAAVACGVALAFVAAVLVARRESRRRFEAAMTRVDETIAPISDALRQTADRADALGDPSDRPPSPRLERVLERIADEGAPAHAFRRLAGELSPELGGWRRLPPAKQPASRDDLTGVRDRAGYEAELEREIARAHRSERPLTLVLLDLGDLEKAKVRSGHGEVDRLLQEFAALLVRSTRVTDTVCRRRRGEFGILLPDTNATGARQFRTRLRGEAGATSFGRLGPVTFSSGIAEWRRDETAEVFDARARLAAGRSEPGGSGRSGAADDDSLGEPSVR